MAFPSTFLDIQQAVQANTRMDPANATDVQQIKDWINQTYYQVVLETECLQESDTMTLTANVADYTLPAAVARIKYMTLRQASQGGFNAPLVLVPPMRILTWRQSAGGVSVTNSTAMYYSVLGLNDLLLYPTPSTADTLLLYYTQYPPILVNNTDVPLLPEPYGSQLLQAGALMEASDYLKDVIASYSYPQQFADWMTRFRQHLRRRAGAQTTQFEKAGGGSSMPHDPSSDVRW